MDLIDRQEALDVLFKLYEYQRDIDPTPAADLVRQGIFLALRKIEYMPSAQPDLDEWCTDCKEYDTERNCCPRWNRVIRQTLKGTQTERKKEKWIWNLINKAPTIEPERKKGKWIYYDVENDKYDDVRCSECGKTFTVDAERWCDIGFTASDLKFCPNCGCDMRQEGEDHE